LTWPLVLIIFFNCIFQVAGVEVAGSDLLGGDRQRNIFPLPPISDDFPSEPHSLGWSSMVNQGINALNVLAGCTNSLNSKKKPTRVQRRALQHISDAFKDVSVVHECDPGRSSLDDLCSSSRLYQVDRSDVVSYARELVSWPKVETSPIPLERCLPVADIEWLATWRQHVLKPEGSCDNRNSPKRPYMDPILKHKQNYYEHFIRELRQRHMIKFKLDTSDAGDLGSFLCGRRMDHSDSSLTRGSSTTNFWTLLQLTFHQLTLSLVLKCLRTSHFTLGQGIWPMHFTHSVSQTISGACSLWLPSGQIGLALTMSMGIH
jgi:hypothetical protein